MHKDADLPFRDVTVLELCTVISGPFAGSLLADLGADVIKIEMPGKGDVQRHSGFKKDGISPWWGVASRNKHCITLDLKQRDGRQLFERLLQKADVLVENYRPGALDRLGFGWDAVHALNPRLVMLSISGYGGTGPLSTRPGFGKISEGLSGIVALTGAANDRPLYVGFSLADASTGLFGVFGVALALFERDINGGTGSLIDLALYEPLFRMIECQLALLAKTGEPPRRQGTNDPYGWGMSDPSRPLFHCVRANKGEWFFISIQNQEIVRRVAGLWGADADLENLPQWAMGMTPDDLRTSLLSAGAQIVPIFDGLGLANNPYFRTRGDVISADHPKLGSFSAPGPIVQSEIAPRSSFNNSDLGEHTDHVLKRLLDMPQIDIDRLPAEGII